MLETSGLWHFKAYDVLIPNPEGPATYVLHCIYGVKEASSEMVL